MRTFLFAVAMAGLLLGGAVSGGAVPVNLNGTHWLGVSAEKMAVKGWGSDTDTCGLDLAFGANTWASEDDEGYSFQGTYSAAKNKYTALLNAAGKAEMERCIKNWIEEYTDFAVQVTITAQKIAGSAKAKNGVPLSLKLKATYVFTVTGGGYSTTGKYAAAGVLFPEP